MIIQFLTDGKIKINNKLVDNKTDKIINEIKREIFKKQ